MVDLFTCPCCGYDGLIERPYKNFDHPPVSADLSPPYAQHFGMPSYEVCDCCGFEFGNDDEPGTAEPVSFQSYFNEWISNGAVWFNPKSRPINWSLDRQLSFAGISYSRPPESGQ